MCPPREKGKNKKRNQKRGKPAVKGRLSAFRNEQAQRKRVSSQEPLQKASDCTPSGAGRAIINADELCCLAITDSGVPLTLGIIRLP